MGAHDYFYFVPYQSDVDAALQELRQREFEAGLHNPVQRYMEFPIGPETAAPGPQHKSIKKALKAADAEGTRSILDIESISDERDFCVAAPLRDDELEQYFGTTQPTHEMVMNNMEFFEDIERGTCIYFTVFKDEKPSELFFAGYSFD